MSGGENGGSFNGSKRLPRPKDVDAAMREVYSLRHQLEDKDKLLREAERRIGSLLDDAETTGVAGESAFARPALSAARKIEKRIVEAVTDLADTAERKGVGAARLKAAMDVLPDIDLLSVGAPAGPLQAARRNLVRRFLTHPGLFALIAEKRPGRQYALTLLAQRISQDFTAPTLRRVFDKSAEIHEDLSGRRGA